jgi:hypothetical protein
MPDVRELGRRVKAKHPGAYDDLSDEDIGRRVKQKFPGAYDDFTDVVAGPARQATPPQPEPGLWEQFKLGAAGAANEIYDAGLNVYEAGREAVKGNFQPAAQMAESVGRGALRTFTTSLKRDSGGAFLPNTSQDARIAELQTQRATRQAQDPLFENVRIARQQIAREEAAAPSLKSKIARGAGKLAVGAVPAVATGILTGGSAPAVAAATALQSANRPEDIPLNTVMAATPIPLGRAMRRAPKSVSTTPGVLTGAVEDEALIRGLARPQAAASATPRTPMLETVTALRKAGLLSGATTHAKNIVSNLTFQPLEEISRIPASIADIAISAVNKQRTITGPSPSAVARSGVAAAMEGVKDAWQILRRGMTNQQAQQLQLGREINSGFKPLDMYINGVFRTLGAEDAVFRKYAFTRAVQDRARAQALSEVRQGKIGRAGVRSRSQQLANDPTIMADAMLDAEIATFNNPSLVSRFTESGMDAIAKHPGGRAANFGVDLVIPFRNAPSNAVGKILEYTPLGMLKNSAQVIRAVQQRAFTPEMQRQFTTTLGRTITGSGLIMLGYQLGKAGLMTGYSETDPSKRDRDIAAGRNAGAILDPTTNTWHSIVGFGPVGPLLVIGATLSREEGRELKDESKRPANLAAAITSTIKEQPLMAGASDLSEAITRPGTTADRAGRIAGSFVPTGISKIGDLTDDKKREAKGFTAQIQRRVPYLRERLPEATDALGRPLESRKSSFFDPTMTSSAKDKTDALMSELVRLDVGISAPRKFDDESEGDYRARKTKAGDLFTKYGKQLVESRQYRNATKERQKAAVERLAKVAREASEDAVPDTWPLSPQGLFESVVASEYRRKANTARR